jgi:hypothetical protein
VIDFIDQKNAALLRPGVFTLNTVHEMREDAK